MRSIKTHTKDEHQIVNIDIKALKLYVVKDLHIIKSRIICSKGVQKRDQI